MIWKHKATIAISGNTIIGIKGWDDGHLACWDGIVFGKWCFFLLCVCVECCICGTMVVVVVVVCEKQQGRCTVPVLLVVLQ